MNVADDEARRHLAATRSRWTETEGWSTPPEDVTPLAPAPREAPLPRGLKALMLVLALFWVGVVAFVLEPRLGPILALVLVLGGLVAVTYARGRR